MTDHEVRLWLDGIFNAVPEAREIFERITGANLEDIPTWMLYGAVKAAADTETTRRQEEREDRIREEEREFLLKIEQGKAEALRYSLNEAATIIREGNREDSERLEQILKSVKEVPQISESGNADEPEKKYQLPPHVDYGDCWRKHPATENFPEGRPGPSQCVQTVPQEDGIHYRCLRAYSAQTPGDSGFARLKYQIFHAELLRQGDCPKPLSRSITRRIPGVSWVFVKPDKCPLADGKEYILKEGGKLERMG